MKLNDKLKDLLLNDREKVDHCAFEQYGTIRMGYLHLTSDEHKEYMVNLMITKGFKINLKYGCPDIIEFVIGYFNAKHDESDGEIPLPDIPPQSIRFILEK